MGVTPETRVFIRLQTNALNSSDQRARVDQLANYTVYDPASDHIEFLSVAGRSGRSNLGFG